MAILFSSCEKEVDTYTNDPRLYFFERGTDLLQTRITSKSFSFVPLASSIVTDTIKIKVKTMGLATATDRVFRGATIKQGTTAVEGTDYAFIDGKIKAGQVEGLLPVVLYRTAKIKSASLTLNLTIADSQDFKVGVVEDQAFTLNWSDDIVKPANWDGLISLTFYFGTYSKTKFRFIIDVTGIADFPLQQSGRVPLNPGEYSNSMMNDIKLRVKDALAAYNSSHATPLTDENGVLVTFPN
ncbi:DUF4843 domain-containing protein [Pedobacter frigidisoli]|uniref:DUF4843 domain-containing protein n=1 Tax=Pedobacter frigidisoli TaxID=2530455 RepID=UPI00293189B2|nr:DUF4843 domain-containing protein [Pedobacter frigidisoli]